MVREEIWSHGFGYRFGGGARCCLVIVGIVAVVVAEVAGRSLQGGSTRADTSHLEEEEVALQE
jgi:hypothetical protein